MYKSHLDLFFCEFWKEFFFKDFINLRERERARPSDGGAEEQTGREKVSEANYMPA